MSIRDLKENKNLYSLFMENYKLLYLSIKIFFYYLHGYLFILMMDVKDALIEVLLLKFYRIYNFMLDHDGNLLLFIKITHFFLNSL